MAVGAVGVAVDNTSVGAGSGCVDGGGPRFNSSWPVSIQRSVLTFFNVRLGRPCS